MSCSLDKLVITKEMVAKVESTEIIWRKALVKGYVNLWVAPSNGGQTRRASLAGESQGRFPAAVRLSPAFRVWLESDVHKWMMSKREEGARLSA